MGSKCFYDLHGSPKNLFFSSHSKKFNAFDFLHASRLNVESLDWNEMVSFFSPLLVSYSLRRLWQIPFGTLSGELKSGLGSFACFFTLWLALTIAAHQLTS